MDAGDTRDDTVSLRLYGVDEPVDDDDLDRLYAYPTEPDRCVVRGNAITSLDGGATTDGTSGGLGGAGDRRIFALQRELADVIVVGAGTARAENYGGARMTAAQRQRRQLRGQSEVPPIALVTRSGVIEHDLGVLTGSEVRPLVLTCAAAAAQARSRVGSAAEVVDCSQADPEQVDLGTALQQLAERGLLRVLTEGGPSLLGTFIAARLLDEICLTSAPLLLGGNAVRIAHGERGIVTPMRPLHVLTDAEGYQYTRYVRGG
jgi:riboflavin biosynthesis pyrimidine reductase